MKSNESREITEEQLPFKVKRHNRPRIIYARKPADDKDLLGFYHKVYDKDTITIYPVSKEKSEDIEEIIEHEIAHYQLENRHSVDEKSLEERAEGELQANLLVYSRIGKPKESLYLWREIGEDLLEHIDTWKVPLESKIKRISAILYDLKEKYRNFLPEGWLEDYNKFAKRTAEKYKWSSLKVIKTFPRNPIYYESLTHSKRAKVKKLELTTARIGTVR